MFIFNKTNELFAYHNDFQEGNILINKDVYKFYSIDFGDLHEHHMYVWYYLNTLARRLKFKSKDNTNINIECMNRFNKMVTYSKRYEMISIMFHGFIL